VTVGAGRVSQVGISILSGGQTGVDRAALDFALAHGIAYCGWCPRGGWAEDLQAPPGLLAVYPRLRETPSEDPQQRTAWNVRDGDATLVLRTADDRSRSPGTALAERAAAALERPLERVYLDGSSASAGGARIAALLAALPPSAALNIAGPRESEVPGIYRLSRRLLEAALLPCIASPS